MVGLAARPSQMVGSILVLSSQLERADQLERRKEAPGALYIRERLQRRHSVDGSSHQYAEHDVVVGDPAHSCAFFEVIIAPFAIHLELLDPAGDVAGHDGVEGHEEWARPPAAVRFAIAVANVVVGTKGDVGVELGEGHVMEDSTCATCSCEVCLFIELSMEIRPFGSQHKVAFPYIGDDEGDEV